MKLIPISRGVLYETAELRNVHKAASQKKLDLADAIHLVTAVHERCRYFVSEDNGIVPPQGMTRMSPLSRDLDELLRVLA